MRDVKRGAPQAKDVLKLVPAATAIAAQLKLPRLEGHSAGVLATVKTQSTVQGDRPLWAESGPPGVLSGRTGILAKADDPPAPSLTREETQRHEGRYLTPYERGKLKAHEVALKWREQGLALVIAVPNGVAGPNDHSTLGYFLRLTILDLMAPVAFGGNAV